MSVIKSEELWKALAPIFGIEGLRVKTFDLRLRMNEPAEITVTHMVDDAAAECAREVVKRFRVVDVEDE